MKKTAVVLSLLFSCAVARDASAYVVNGDAFIFSDENTQGYRRITSIEPSSGDQLPVSDITVYPESEQTEAIAVDHTESPAGDSSETTLILQTHIPIQP